MLLLYAVGDDAYAGRWKSAGGNVRRELAGPLNQAEGKQRHSTLCQALGAQDLSLQIQELRDNKNVIFIIDNKVSYADL